MILHTHDFDAGQDKRTLVSGVSGKVILVVRLCISTHGSGRFRLWSDPNGASERSISPALRAAASATFDLRLGRPYALAVERGKALGFSSVLAEGPQDHSVMLWYEVVR